MSCNLKPIPDSTDFQAPTGSTVNLSVTDHIGHVLIAKAVYNGNQLIPANQAVASIGFTVASGPQRLALVFVFSAGENGAAELDEICSGGGSQHIRDIFGDEPFQALAIEGV